MAQSKEPELSKENAEKRDLILSGSVWKAVFSVCVPMAIFELLNQIFRVFDMWITSDISTTAVSAVSFFTQTTNTFSSIGNGFAIGAGIIIAGYYGSGEFLKVKKIVSSVLTISFCFSVIMSFLLIIGGPIIMNIVNATDEIRQEGYNYYLCQVICLIFSFINSVFIAIEKAKGNGKMILYMNLILAFFKFALTFLFVKILHFGIESVAIATLMSNIILSTIGIYRASRKNNIFGFSAKMIDLSWSNIKSVVIISLPVIAEKVAFSAGKVMVNSVGSDYGTKTVGALGVSNSISAISTTPPSSIGDGGSAIIRQNIGAGNKNRVLDVFRTLLIINIIYGTVGLILTLVFLDPLVSAFSSDDEIFKSLVKTTFSLEMYSNVALAVTGSVMGLLYGLGYTKISFAINFSRLFIFRLPLLLILSHLTNIEGATVMGMVMMVSNGLTGIFSVIAGCAVIKKEYGKEGFNILFRRSYAKQ